MKRFGLRAKFILLLSVSLILLFTVVAFVLVRQDTNNLRSNLEEQAKSFASLSIEPIGDSFVLYQDSGRIRILQQTQKFLDLNPDVTRIDIVDIDGELRFSSDADYTESLPAELASTFEPEYLYGEDGELTHIVQPFIEDFGGHRYTMVYSVSNQRINDAISQVIESIVILSIIALIISVVLAYFLINAFFLRPLGQVSASALQISKGDFTKQIEDRRHDEIGDLADAVNTMANALRGNIAKLQEVDKLKNEFLMITSHNLRTPLTIMSGHLESLKTMRLGIEAKKAFNAIAASNVRLNNFAEDVLTVSTLEAGEMVLHKQPTSIKPAIDRVADEFKQLALQKDLEFEYKNQLGDEQANISTAHFRSALWNLLDNSYKFTEKGGKVAVTAKVVDNAVEIEISDSGIGIEAEEMPKLFTKFHRGTSALQYDYEGVGIGLYLAKLIMQEQQGDIQVTSTPGKGSTFTVILPLLNSTTGQQE